jgi:RNA binding exosome subunit
LHSSIEISILIHATENENKVLNSLIDFIGLSRESIQIRSIRTEGHWRNPIIRLIITVNNDVDRIFNELYARLVELYGESYTKNYLETNTDVKEYIYIRLDKQGLFNRNIMLSDRDSVRIVFKKLSKYMPQRTTTFTNK